MKPLMKPGLATPRASPHGGQGSGSAAAVLLAVTFALALGLSVDASRRAGWSCAPELSLLLPRSLLYEDSGAALHALRA